ncbi:hypothetical protein DFJ58DRAFT_805530 [Suillus subalutaceus]|uniref:uncharacterized protein n=1 Tax=Suillus subalutaceus TaxID=48586 RepID=UPI001B85F1DF|nr:uncharacterized protein DFJ58DRAFT_805530 [Suillus subalutaceus]KAG1842875.1 hypothetical protein DFJ58DRAFT_805530 [Suillus subalutaceus]
MVFFVLWVRAPSIDDVVLYSPVNEVIESIGIIRFNGTLDAPSIYRGSPSPEIDAAWDRISPRLVRMTLEQLLRTGEKPSPAMARYPDEYGGGYMANVEVIHQLHCINMLRRASWGDHDNSSGHDSQSRESFWRIHLVPQTIASRMLRQNIMCRGDVTMLTYDWVEGCRNFDKVLNWLDERRVVIPKSKMDLSSPP